MKEESLIQVDKANFDNLMNLLDLNDLHCSDCGVKITKDNFGFIAKDVYSCNNILCLMKAYDKFEGKK